MVLLGPVCVCCSPEKEGGSMGDGKKGTSTEKGMLAVIVVTRKEECPFEENPYPACRFMVLLS